MAELIKMKNIQQAKEMLSDLTRAEKAELLQWVVQEGGY